MKRNCIVTGGAGFIGANIAKRLLEQGNHVIVLDNLSTGCEENIPAGAEFINIDLGDEDAFHKLENLSADAVFHLAAQSSGEASFRDPYYDFHSHVTSTFCLLDWCRRKGCKRFLYASSMSVYGDPTNLPVTEGSPLQPKTFYAAGKAAAESYVRLYQTLGIDTTIFRMFSVYGPGQNLDNMMQGMVSIYMAFMLRQEPILVKGSRERFRDFVYIRDVVDAWTTSLDDGRAFGRTFNLGSGAATTVEELVALLRTANGTPDHPVDFADSTPGDQFGMYADISSIKGHLGWQPQIDLKEGLERMLQNARKRSACEN